MWLKEHKKQVIIVAVVVVLIVAALIAGIFIGKGKQSQPTVNDTATEEATDTTEDNTTEADNTDEKDTKFQSGVYDVRVYASSTWENEGSIGGTYNVSFTNKSDADVKEWYAEIEVPEGSSVTEAWGCKAEVEGTTLTVTAIDWGAAVTKGSKVDVGFNMDTKEKFKPEIAALYVDGEKQDGSAATTEAATTEEIEPAVKPEVESGTPLENHGALRVEGTQLVDENGKPYQLKGVSTHGLAWFPAYVNKEAFQTIRDDWGGNVVRLAMYTSESGGYCSDGNPEDLKALIDDGVNYATELGMYVIIDWHVLHDTDPQINQSEAEAFFAEMSAKYANYDNVIYEICNEPNGGATWEDSIRPYAEDIIPIIRKNDKDAIIIVGTPTWSQDVDVVADDLAENPLENSENVMFAIHFYAATHTDNIRSKVTYALDKGLPVFVSEFSICDASGNGANDYDQAEQWFDLINSNNLSYCSWSLCNKDETSALISSDSTKTSDWTESDLSETGQWIRSQIRGE